MHRRKHLFFTSGCHYLEACIPKQCNEDTAVGVCDASGECVLAYSCNGCIVSPAGVVGSALRYSAGDTVGLAIDMNQRRIAFFLNGILQYNPKWRWREPCPVVLDGIPATESWLCCSYAFNARETFAGYVGDDMDMYRSDPPPGRSLAWSQYIHPGYLRVAHPIQT